MKDIKRRYEVYSFYDYTGMALHLSKMAQKGWLVEKVSNFGWTYRRIDPKKLTFFISYFPKASAFDPEPTEEQKMFYDFCKHTGWILAATFNQMQIFYNEQENPTPIETDPVLEVETIHRAVKKSFVPSVFGLLVISLLNGSLLLSRLMRDPIEVLSSSGSLFAGFALALLFLQCVVELCGYFIWHSKAKKAAECDEFVKSFRSSGLQRVILAVLLVGVACWFLTFIMLGSVLSRVIGISMILYMIALIVLVNAVKQFMKRKKVSKNFNRTITYLASFIFAFAMMGGIIFGVLRASQSNLFGNNGEKAQYYGRTLKSYMDEAPLTVEDLLAVDDDDYSRYQRGEESLLLGQFVMILHPGDVEQWVDIPWLEYTITEVRASFLYNMCKNFLLQEYDVYNKIQFPYDVKRVYEAQDASAWGAQEVYRLISQDTGPMNRYLLCYKDRIVEIKFDWEPTAEQMAIVGRKLSGE